MQPGTFHTLPPATRIRPRSALVVSSDRSFGQRLSDVLTGLRWQVRTADNGAQAWGEAEMATPEALITDTWLPDLEIAEFLADFRGRFPQVELISSSTSGAEDVRGPHHQELLYALRRSQDLDECGGAEKASVASHPAEKVTHEPHGLEVRDDSLIRAVTSSTAADASGAAASDLWPHPDPPPRDSLPRDLDLIEPLPELIGKAASMLEVSRRVRLVAPRITPVLIEGPTGSGKETGGRGAAPPVATEPEALCRHQLRGHSGSIA